MIRVGYIAGEPSPARVALLELIALRCELELTVIYAAADIQRRDWTVTFEHEPIMLRGPRIPAMRLLHHDYPLTPQIWRLLDRSRFDVLVIGGWSLLATELAIVWARLHKVPYLLIVENNLREPRPAWISALKRLVLPWIVRPAAGHLVTGTLAAEHQRHYGAKDGRVTTFANTLDVQAFARRVDEMRPQRTAIRAKLGVPAEGVVLSVVGRLIAFKALDEAIEAVKRAQGLTDAELHLLVVGSGPLRVELERLAQTLQAPVTFTGWLDGDALLEAYVASDVFVLLSRREAWGYVVNEAAAAGLPLILTDRVGASADLLVAGENGELVASGDVGAQAVAIARLASDKELRQRYGRRSRELVEPWGYEPNVERFVAAIERAVSA